MDFFDLINEEKQKTDAPLAERMKPRTLDEFYGQEHVLGPNKLLRRLIIADRLSSIILHGPPGVGKTSIARVIANQTSSEFVSLNAVTSGVKELREVMADAKERQLMEQRKTILFIDEIHRFNKAQQDALLPHVEKGVVTLIGATTENPYFEVNNALLSRSQVFRLKPLEEDHIAQIIERVLEDKEVGLGDYGISITDDAKHMLIIRADGDARRVLNALDLAVLSNDGDPEGMVIDVDIVSECLQVKANNFDKNGDYHYDVVSAFIKSMRGSDPDAALHYLARMIDGGEDPKFIARRVVICASEDVGNANPNALVVAQSAAEAVHWIGMPEGRIILSQAVTYVTSSPKSNAAYVAIDEALEDVMYKECGSIPEYLKDGTTLKMEKQYTKTALKESYVYPHDYPLHYVKQQYLPTTIANKQYYRPTRLGAEKNIDNYLNATKWLKE